MPAVPIWDSARMRVHIGSDHAGYELKNYLIAVLTEDGHELVDHGPDSYDAEDDYPVFCIPAAEAAVADPGSLCIVIGGSGNGEQIAANKVVGARAALAYDLDTARLGREHNDANVVGIGARMHTQEEAWRWCAFSSQPPSAVTHVMLGASNSSPTMRGRVLRRTPDWFLAFFRTWPRMSRSRPDFGCIRGSVRKTLSVARLLA